MLVPERHEYRPARHCVIRSADLSGRTLRNPSPLAIELFRELVWASHGLHWTPPGSTGSPHTPWGRGAQSMKFTENNTLPLISQALTCFAKAGARIPHNFPHICLLFPHNFPHLSHNFPTMFPHFHKIPHIISPHPPSFFPHHPHNPSILLLINQLIN